jgi:hypothetical protein
MIVDRPHPTIDLLLREIESLRRAREILRNIYCSNPPYVEPIVHDDDWKDMKDYFQFDDSE